MSHCQHLELDSRVYLGVPLNAFLFQVVITVRDIRPRLVEEADAMGIKVRVGPEPAASILFPAFWTLIQMRVPFFGPDEGIMFSRLSEL